MTADFAETLWGAVFAACLAGASLIVAMSAYISDSLKGARPENIAASKECNSRLRKLTFASVSIFIFYMLMGFPYVLIKFAPDEYRNTIENCCNSTLIDISSRYHSLINEGCAELLLIISYSLFLITVIIYLVFLIGIGIIYKIEIDNLSHDDYKQEPFYKELKPIND